MLSPDVASTTINDGEKEPLINNKFQPTRKKQMLAKIIRTMGALFAISLNVAIWVAMAEGLQDLDRSYTRTVFQTYLLHSSYSLLYVLWKFWLVFPGNRSCNSAGEGTLTNFKKLAIISAVLAFCLYASDIFWFKSLPLTSVSANTAVYQSEPAITFLISIPVLKERVTVVKLVGVLFSLAGVFLISFFSSKSDSDTPTFHNSTELVLDEYRVYDLNSSTSGHSGEKETNTPLGYVFVLSSTLLYSIFEIIFKKWATREDDTAPVCNSLRLIGYVGVHTLVAYWPLVVIVHFMGLEVFQLPTLKQFRLLIIMSFLDIVFNGSLLVAIALSSPLFAVVGSVLALPGTMFVDWILKGYVLSWQALLGVGGIVVGFILLVLSEIWEVRQAGKTMTPSSPRQHSENSELASINVSSRSFDSLSSSSKLWKTFRTKYLI